MFFDAPDYRRDIQRARNHSDIRRTINRAKDARRRGDGPSDSEMRKLQQLARDRERALDVEDPVGSFFGF